MEKICESISKKQDICFIRPKQRGDDYCFDGIEKTGYKILIPYKDYNLLLRCLREAWFRLKFPKREIWFNKKICHVKAKVFIVKDPLMVSEFFLWLKKIHPASKIILDYDNRADRTINPSFVDSSIVEKWSYDADDCRKYNMNLKHGAYLDIYRIDKLEEPEYDILYLGRDKGRAKKIFDLESEFQKLGLKTNFHICADRAFLKFKHQYYKSVIPYREYLEMLKRSRAILNIVQPGQTSITMREYEAVFDNVKCITNNQTIKQFELYHSSRYFVLGQDDMALLSVFLNTKFLPVSEEKLNEYKFSRIMEMMEI